MKKITAVSFLSILMPSLALAATNKNLSTLIDLIISYANKILVLMMGVAIVMFVYYIIKYFIRADAERKEAGPYVMWSLIGFFVILSMWGLVNILQNTFGLQNDTNRPAGWNSFTNIFPGGGSTSGGTSSGGINSVPTQGSSGGINSVPSNQGSGWYNPAWNVSGSGQGEQ